MLACLYLYSLPYNYIHRHVMIWQNVWIFYSCCLVRRSLVIFNTWNYQQSKVNKSGQQIEDNLTHSCSTCFFIQCYVVKTLNIGIIISVSYYTGHIDTLRTTDKSILPSSAPTGKFNSNWAELSLILNFSSHPPPPPHPNRKSSF